MKTKTLCIIALALAASFVPAVGALTIGDDCRDNETLDSNTIYAPPAAFFVNQPARSTPGEVAPIHQEPDQPGRHVEGDVASQHQNSRDTPAGPTGPIDTPAVDGPGADAPGVDAPGVDTPGAPLPAQATVPAVKTMWMPDCITIKSGDTVEWQNADAEAVHGPKFVNELRVAGPPVIPENRCWTGNGALIVPEVDRDIAILSFDPSTRKVVADITSFRATSAANTANPGVITPVTRHVECGGSQAVIAVDEVARVATLEYQCLLHNKAMVGHIRIEY